MELVRSSIFLLFVLLGVNISYVYGLGNITIELMEYDNPGGKDANGNCCDGFSIFCPTSCDHFFTLCLDDVNLGGPSDMSQCRYGKIQTGEVKNANKIVKFGSKIGNTQNPMTFVFNSWPGLFNLKVHVEDHDTTSANDFVDFMQTIILVPTPERINSTPNVQEVIVSGRTSLTLRVRVICDGFHYGPKCDKFCEENKHYKCDQITGDIICKPGWTGKKCDETKQV